MKNSKKYISWFTVLILGLFFTMQFILAKGIAASEENTAISFRFDGVVSSYEEMKAQDNSFEVYVKAQGDTEYKTLAQAASDNNGAAAGGAAVTRTSAGSSGVATSPKTGSGIPAIPVIALLALMSIAVCTKKAHSL